MRLPVEVVVGFHITTDETSEDRLQDFPEFE